jgi:HK97 family phage major capsid protein
MTAMNIVQLENDLRAAKEKASVLIEATAVKCRDHVVTPATATAAAITGRLMTADERAAIATLLADAEAIQTKIDGAQSDAALLARFDQIRGGAARPASSSPVPARPGSLGQQFVHSAEYQSLIKNRMHRASSAWSSGVVECIDATFNAWTMRATTLTEDAASGGKLLVPQYQPGIQQLMFKRLVIADLLASGTTDSNAIVYMVETLFTNAAATVAEGSPKPESALVFDQKTEPVSKIAHWLPTTEELLEDVSAIMAYIDARLRLGVGLAEEDQLLNGNGTPPNLLGLLNRSGLATAVARASGATPPETNMDAILRQVTAIATTAFVYPDGVVMNPTNWFTAQISKDTNGQYYGGGPFSTLPTAMMWGLPVVPTPSIVAGTAFVGAFGSEAQVFRRGGLRVEASNSHQDFFIKNLVAIRAEERLALAVYRPGAFGKVTGLN